MHALAQLTLVKAPEDYVNREGYLVLWFKPETLLLYMTVLLYIKVLGTNNGPFNRMQIQLKTFG